MKFPFLDHVKNGTNNTITQCIFQKGIFPKQNKNEEKKGVKTFSNDKSDEQQTLHIQNNRKQPFFAGLGVYH